MSYNGSGTFVINTAGQPVVSGTVISSTAFNALTADLATGLSTAITKDGQTTPTANIPMGNNKITNLAVGTAATDAANLSQVQSTTAKLVNSISGADTITGTMSPTLGAYATGQMFYFIAAGDNTGAVTLNIDSLGAKAVTRDGTTALAAGDIQSGEVCVVVYDGTRFQLVNGASQSASIVTENLTVNKATVLNESGGDNDTRIEGDTDANLVFVDASTDRVGIGTNAPVQKLDVDRGASNGVAARFGRSGGQFAHIYADTNSVYLSSDSSGNTSWEFNETNDYLAAWTGGTERLRLVSGNLGLGVTPSAWSAGKALEMSVVGNGIWCSPDTYLIRNCYYNSGWKYASSAAAANYYIDSTGQHIWSYAASGTAGNAITFTQAMTLSAAGGLSVGTTDDAGAGNIRVPLQKSYTCYTADYGIGTPSSNGLQIYTGSGDFISFSNKSGSTFTERARITSGGDLLVGKTSSDSGTAGCEIQASGQYVGVRNGLLAFYNRLTTDGDLISFRQAGTEEGSISVSGNTVSYNAFAGSHWSQLQDGSKPDILRGTVMESINELCAWPGEQNERLPKAKISDTAGSKKVYGVFMAWDNDWTATNDMYVTAVGAFICRVNGSVTVQEGDLLESNGDGTARVQADDIIRSSTIGKVTSTVKTHQYDDGSYCVPTVLYCG